MSKVSIQTQISRAYLLGSLVLLLFYYLVLEIVLYNAEDQFAERRLKIVTPQLATLYTSRKLTKPWVVDPMLTIYPDFRALPNLVKTQLAPGWSGLTEVDGERFDTEVSYLVHAVPHPVYPEQILYLLENISDAESHDEEISNLSSSLIFVGVLLVLVAFYFMLQLASKLSQPLIRVSCILSSAEDQDFSSINIPATASREIQVLVNSINQYRHRLSKALVRERAFTGYVSHELRTPLTVVKMASALMQSIEDARLKRYQQKIQRAATDMERLINTFLMLAREQQQLDTSFVYINELWLQQLLDNHNHLIEATEVHIQYLLSEPLQLKVPETLLYVIVSNLLKNACIHASGGRVEILLTSELLVLSDQGGLTTSDQQYPNAEPHLSHGIGLVLVREICQKLGWSFQLLPNQRQGHDAIVRFHS
jgi:signal transduction histidine kinase